ncbi:apolipoprotein C-I [Genypterus blacodes]|uniref:apolipoprotein C-I n=1 Tax=Genypterus blacodes TaxID=154954 RepID=UPI003F75A975
MKLYLAVAVLLLALAAYTEAQDAGTFEEKVTQLGTQVSEVTKDWVDKAKVALEGIPTSEIATNMKTWVNDQISRMKASFEEMTQN